MSYRGVLNWGLMACAETVPGVATIAASIPEALDELRAAAGLVPSTPAGVAPGHPRRRRTVPARQADAALNGTSSDVSSP
jgi:hypothetical protein